MRLNTNASAATGTGMSETKKFAMQMGAKAARVLSDTLYKDKHGSIIRELCSNAYDAHKMVGKEDVPFDLTLPDPFTPMLTIRDYGPGISPEDIVDVYCVYFGSTKDNENDSIGAFGLGSKTPFSLSDMFTVTSYQNGKKRVYTVYLDEGEPAISLFGESETDEPDGLEVSVTVDKKDVNPFRDAVLRQLRFFPVKPNVNTVINWPTITETLVEVDGFSYFQHDSDILRGFFIKTGPVAYPVDFDVLINHYKNSDRKMPELVSFMQDMANRGSYGYSYGRNNQSNKGAVLDMPIGTVEVTPSREGLSYTDDTLNNIVDAIEGIRSKFFDTIRDSLKKKYKAGNQAFIQYFKSLDKMMLDSIDTKYIEQHFKPFTFHRGQLSIVLPENMMGLEVKHYDTYSGSGKPRLRSTHRLAHRWDEQDRNILHFDSKGEAVVCDFKDTDDYRRELQFIVNTPNTTYFIQDENYAFAARSYDHHQYQSSRRSCEYYVINTADCAATDKEVIKYLERFVVDSDVVRISDTKKPTKAHGKGFSTTGGRKRVWFDLTKLSPTAPLRNHTLYKIGANSVYDDTMSIDDIADEREDKYVFFTTFNNTVMEPEHGFEIVPLLLNYINRYLDDGTRVIAVAKNQRKKFSKLDSAIYIDDYLTKYRDDIVDAIKEDMCNVFGSNYNENIQRKSHYFEMLLAEIDSEDDLDVTIDFDMGRDWPYGSSKIIHGFHGNTLEYTLEKLDAESLYQDFQKMRNEWQHNTSIDDAESFLTKHGVDFVSLKDKFATLHDELLDKKNSAAVLRMMVRNRDVNARSKVLDPFVQNGTRTLLDMGVISDAIIERVA